MIYINKILPVIVSPLGFITLIVFWHFKKKMLPSFVGLMTLLILSLPIVSGQLIKLLENSQRPMVLLGGGAANSKATIETVNHVVNLTNIHVVITYAGTSIISHNYKPYLGCIGIKGSRAANFLLQNCDFLLVLGSRVPFGAIGYDIKSFALNAKIYVVEIDGNEILKNQYNFGERINLLVNWI